MKRSLLIIALVLFGLFSGFVVPNVNNKLKEIIEQKGLSAYSQGILPDSAKVELGRMLFFDKILSGNKDISCATCHHPGLKSGDHLSLAIGVGGQGLGESRKMGEQRKRIPRNSPEIFNRGANEWHTMFWDGRVSGSPDKGFINPADQKLPDGLENVLAAQAMFPVFARDEMRGETYDKDIFGRQNELALISNAAPQSVWHALMRRLMTIPEYRSIFQSAYPDVPLDKMGFQYAANAIAAFEIAEFTFVGSPWDRYLSGDVNALSEQAKRGALVFYQKANCAACHSGNLFTDQGFHNIGIPQFGPGKENAVPLDVGRFAETGVWSDRFAFRTPPLRNVTITGPWMHNGAYVELEDAVHHHLNTEYALKNYEEDQLSEELKDTYKGDVSVINKVLETLDPLVQQPNNLSEQDMDDLMAFLSALTDSSAINLDGIIPEKVPSGLPVENLVEAREY